MAPYFDFDWAWSGQSVELPKAAEAHIDIVKSLAESAAGIKGTYKHKDLVIQHAKELLQYVLNITKIAESKE
jgi:hypothetical protein